MIFKLNNFSEGPHWDCALIEATGPEEAKDALAEYLKSEPETVWGVRPRSEWGCWASSASVLFVLGAGCRE